MTAPDAGDIGGWFQRALVAPYGWTRLGTPIGGSFPYSVDECQQVIGVGLGAGRGQRQPDDFPATWHGEGFGVGGAQIVTMRFRVGGQRA